MVLEALHRHRQRSQVVLERRDGDLGCHQATEGVLFVGLAEYQGQSYSFRASTSAEEEVLFR